MSVPINSDRQKQAWRNLTPEQREAHKRYTNPEVIRRGLADYEARLASGAMERDVADTIAKTNEDVRDISRLANERLERELARWREEDRKGC